MILNTITILALFLAIIFLIILIVKPVEKFTWTFDARLKQKVDLKNTENRNLNIQKNLVENDIRKRKTIDQIAKEVDKFENVLTFIKENINNIPVCREIDLRPDLRPTCSTIPLSTCSLNSFCVVKNNQCQNRELNPECADILEVDSNGRRTGKASKMFVYPTVLEEIN